MIFSVTLLGWLTKDWVHRAGHSPVCQILLQIVVRAVITSSPPAWTSSAGMLSNPADFPIFNSCTAAYTSLRKRWWSSSVCVWGQFSTDGSPLALWLYSSEQYSVHRFSISRSSVDGSSFPLFHSGQVFRELVCPLTVVLPHRFCSISLHCYPLQDFFPLFLIHFLMLLLSWSTIMTFLMTFLEIIA